MFDIILDLKKTYAENKWLDHLMIDRLLKVFDALWPELFPKYSKSLIIILIF